jgi:hypothetical protein
MTVLIPALIANLPVDVDEVIILIPTSLYITHLLLLPLRAPIYFWVRDFRLFWFISRIPVHNWRKSVALILNVPLTS